jgi:death-on-curing protein
LAGTSQPVDVLLDRVVRLHDYIIQRYGGAPGVLDGSMLQAAIERPWAGLADGTQYFSGVIEKAAVLLERLINYHPFVDGNKRTAAMLVFEFLRAQGFLPEVDSCEVVDTVVRIASRRMSYSEITAWLDRITPARVSPIHAPVPCPWCGDERVDTRTLLYGQAAPLRPDSGLPASRQMTYWTCPRCHVTYTGSDALLALDGDYYLLHARRIGDPLAGKVVTGPWWTDKGVPPDGVGGLTVASDEVSAPARDWPQSHLAEVVAAVRKRRQER